ncbi:unnamed protein product [Amoebophrya sp. A25]|nr:unnamed protein product [Amoebophrya sp. A25]|eukprot:GSA25T00025607001.1
MTTYHFFSSSFVQDSFLTKTAGVVRDANETLFSWLLSNPPSSKAKETSADKIDTSFYGTSVSFSSLWRRLPSSENVHIVKVHPRGRRSCSTSFRALPCCPGTDPNEQPPQPATDDAGHPAGSLTINEEEMKIEEGAEVKDGIVIGFVSMLVGYICSKKAKKSIQAARVEAELDRKRAELAALEALGSENELEYTTGGTPVLRGRGRTNADDSSPGRDVSDGDDTATTSPTIGESDGAGRGVGDPTGKGEKSSGGGKKKGKKSGKKKGKGKGAKSPEKGNRTPEKKGKGKGTPEKGKKKSLGKVKGR